MQTRLRCVFILLFSQRHEAVIFLSTVQSRVFLSVKASAAVSASISLACYHRLRLYLLHAEATLNHDEKPLE